MHFITSDEQLKTYIPNIVQTVPGEVSIYDKMIPFLKSSEEWVIDTFIGEELSTKIHDDNNPEGYPVTSLQSVRPLRLVEGLGGRIIALDAFMHAIPSLDLILTPNGFGIVSNNTIAPASKERVERLVAELEVSRDNEINALLKVLPKYEEWLGTEQAANFSSTLFPSLDICKRLGITQHVWDNYNQLQEEILAVEHEIEESSIGHELMQVFRFDALTKRYTTSLHMRVIRALSTYIISVVRQNRYEKVSVNAHGHLLTDVVNIIRENPETFPEWHDSCVSELFEPPLFENKKNASGYFF